jgi:hypothetical protein
MADVDRLAAQFEALSSTFGICRPGDRDVAITDLLDTAISALCGVELLTHRFGLSMELLCERVAHHIAESTPNERSQHRASH